jgi:GT2 family glycosyltransferase
MINAKYRLKRLLSYRQRIILSSITRGIMIPIRREIERHRANGNKSLSVIGFAGDHASAFSAEKSALAASGGATLSIRIIPGNVKNFREKLNQVLIQSSGGHIAFVNPRILFLERGLIDEMREAVDADPPSLFCLAPPGDPVVRPFAASIPSLRDYYRLLATLCEKSAFVMVPRRVFLRIGLFECDHPSFLYQDLASRVIFHYPSTSIRWGRNRRGIKPPYSVASDFQRREDCTLEIDRRREFGLGLREGKIRRKISFVILSLNRVSRTVACIESIEKELSPYDEIILFDNHSDAKNVGILRRFTRRRQHVRLITSRTNLRAPAGKAEALRHCAGDLIMMLDNDVVLQPGCVLELLTAMEADPEIGAVGCQVCLPDDRVQLNGGTYALQPPFIEFSLLDAGKSVADLAVMRRRACEWLPAGATLYKREIFDRIDMSRDVVDSFEDNDLSLQITKLGYRIVNCPTAKVRHDHIKYHFLETVRERRYLVERYNDQVFLGSILNFYRKHGLLIKIRNDVYVQYDDSKTAEEIIAEIEYRLAIARGCADSGGR